jgi:hypothetical protein
MVPGARVMDGAVRTTQMPAQYHLLSPAGAGSGNSGSANVVSAHPAVLSGVGGAGALPPTGDLTFVLPLERVSCFAPLFQEFELAMRPQSSSSSSSRLRLHSYGISLTSLEQVFVNLADTQPHSTEDLSKVLAHALPASAAAAVTGSGGATVVSTGSSQTSGSTPTATVISSHSAGSSAHSALLHATPVSSDAYQSVGLGASGTEHKMKSQVAEVSVRVAFVGMFLAYLTVLLRCISLSVG